MGRRHVTSALLVMSYGTPASIGEVEAYYTHIRRGRPPSPEQLADLLGRYRAIGGLSPLAERTRAQAAAIAAELDAARPGGWRVALGSKHAAPFIEEAVAGLAAGDRGDTNDGNDGPGPPERIVGLVLAPHWSRGSVGEYHARAGDAAAALGVPYVPVDSWRSLPAWIDAQAERVRTALAGLPARTEVLFSAHSLPERVLAGDPYADELAASAKAIATAAALGRRHPWSLAWQSAGRTPEPWRGPDVTEVIGDLAASGRADGVLVCPQGFVADHLEVLYDLDVEARAVAAEAGLAFARTASINDEPTVMSGLADLVRAA